MLSLLLLLAAPAAQATAVDPLAPARAGKLRCVDPDVASRTCSALIRYTERSEGGFDAQVDGIVGNDPLVVLSYVTRGEIEDGAICATVRPADVNAGTLTGETGALAPALESEIRDQLRLGLQPLAGKKRCTRDGDSAGSDGNFVADVTIAGVVRPEMRQAVRWVSPDEGYALGE